MKQIISIFLIFLSPFFYFGQEFKGVIEDQNTSQAISNANIYIFEIQSGTITNDNGIFVLKNIPNKILTLQISHINYKTKIVEIDFSKEKEKTFFLESSHFKLQEVVASVPRGKLQKENVLYIEHRDIKSLNQTAPLNLTEAITAIPGVETSTTGTGIGKPIIRGLSGNRIVTYAQGIRIENQQWGDEHGLGIGDVGIESVEVIKGPASLLYGSDALGGVLYFIDERFAKQHYIESFVSSQFHSNTLGTYNDFGLKINKNKLKWNVFGSYTSNSDYQVPDEKRVYNTRFDEKNIKTSLGYSNKNWVSKIGYSFLDNSFGITEEDSIYSNSTERGVALPFQTISNHNISWENTLFPNNSKLNFILGYTGNNRKEFEESSDTAALDMNLQSYTYNFKWYAPTIKEKVNIIVGTQGMYQNNSNNGEELIIPDALTTDIGAFSVFNLSLNKLNVLSGVRWDYRHINSKEHFEGLNPQFSTFKTNYTSINYSLGGVYNMQNVAFRMNFSSGFRAPNTSELLSNGVHEGTNQYVQGNTNLQSENANQIDFSFDYKGKHLSFSVNPFFNSVKNYIFLSPTNDTIDDALVYEYLQTEANLYGGELGIHYHPHKMHWLHLESNLSTVFAQDNNGQPLPLIPATNLNSTIRANFSQEGKFQITDFFVNHIYKFGQNRIGLFETNSSEYHLINVGANFKITTKNQPIELMAGARNILNTKYIDHLSRLKPMGVLNQGISFYAGVKINFEKRMNNTIKQLN